MKTSKSKIRTVLTVPSFLIASVGLLAGCGDDPTGHLTATAGSDDRAVRAIVGRGGGDDEAALLVGNFTVGAANGVFRYQAATGNFIDHLVPEGSGGLTIGCCMTFGPDENLYVGSPIHGGGPPGSVLRYNGVTGEFIDAFVPEGTSPLIVPLVPVFGPDGNLYVGDVGAQQIVRYDGETGAFIDVFVTSPAGGLDPQLFVFGPDGDLYVASFSTDQVLRFDGTTGDFLDVFVPARSDGLGTLSGLTFGPDGELYVTSPSTDEVLRFDGTTGAFLDMFVPAGSGGLRNPVGLAFGPEGDLYVASSTGEAGDGSVLRYDGMTGDFVETFVPSGRGGISGPRVILFKSQIELCHSPPGSPAGARTITIGYLSARDHVAHGDALGACG